MRRSNWGTLFLLILVLAAGCARVEPDEAGVRTNYLLFKGVSDKVLEPGLYLSIPQVTEVTSYLIRESKYEMAAQAEQGDTAGRDDVDCHSSDGQKVWVNTTIRYQLQEQDLPSLHRTYGKTYIQNAIRPMARALVAYKFGELSSQEIYQGANRQRIGEEVKRLMNEGYESEPGMRSKGIKILDVLFRSFEFTEEYQTAIEHKQLAVEQRHAAEELAKKREAEAEGEKLAAIKVAEGEAEAIRRKAEADKAAQELRAAGIRAVGLAEAEAQKKMVEALGGGEYLVRLEFARQLADKLQIWGVPTGSQSTSFLDLSGVFGEMYPSKRSAAAPAP